MGWLTSFHHGLLLDLKYMIRRLKYHINLSITVQNIYRWSPVKEYIKTMLPFKCFQWLNTCLLMVTIRLHSYCRAYVDAWAARRLIDREALDMKNEPPCNVRFFSGLKSGWVYTPLVSNGSFKFLYSFGYYIVFILFWYIVLNFV